MKNIYLYTDGAARGNPGPAGAGIVLVDGDGCVVLEHCRYLGEATNNQAEYLALNDGLAKALEMGFSNINICMDSELIVKQIKGEYRIKNEGLRPHFKKAMELLAKFDVYKIKHVPRENNKSADRLANRAIDEAL